MGGRCDDGQLVAADLLQPTLKDRDGEEEGNDGNEEGDGACWADEHLGHEAGESRTAIDQERCSYIQCCNTTSSIQETSAESLSAPS